MTSHEPTSGGPHRIGRYQVQSSIGVGGFARVFRAYDESLDDAVAIKVLAEKWAEDPDIRERFLEEAKLLRRVRSPHLITVHDIGELEDGRPYFVMEFADAGTLAGRLETRRTPGLDGSSARAIIDALADGLGALHATGVIHRDINPKNVLIRHARDRGHEPRAAQATQLRPGLIAPGEQLLLGDLGLAKDVVRAGSGAVSVIGGTAHYMPPEQADPNGVVGPATDVYAASGVLWESLTATPPPDPARLALSATGLDERWQSFFAMGLAGDAQDRFQTMEQWRVAALTCLADGDVQVATTSRRVVESDHSPYMGLASFQPEDADRFFGRSAMVDDLVARLRSQKMLVVGGPSGSGKSSIVRAGLIPAIARGAIAGSERWPIALFTPGADPLGELAYQLSKLGLSATQQVSHSISAADLAADPARGRLLGDLITEATGGALLVMDQFEELFTQGPSREGQQAVLDTLAALVDPADSRIRVVIAVRADFYGTCASFPWLADKITANQVLVGPMGRLEMREAIEEPARAVGLVVEEAVVDAVLDEGGSEPGALPLVSHALAETWRRRRGSMLTLDGYREAGGVSGAIALTANALYDDKFGPEERAAVRRLMLRLVNPGEGTADTRRSLPVADLATSGSSDILTRVAEEMTDARLLTASEDTIEIAHEALISTWPRLRQWIEESRDDLRTRQHIGRAATEWIEQERNADLLYRGTALHSALEWAETRQDVLEASDREFLDASRGAYEAAIAETERAAGRARRVRRIAVSILGGLTIVAAIATVVALGALRVANARFSQSLATQSVALVEDSPRLALALAVEAIARGQSESIEARTTLIEASRVLAASPLAPATSGAMVGDALSVAIRADGSLVAVGLRDGSIQLWDTMGGEPTGAPISGHTKAINDMRFTNDGTALLTASDDKTIRRWDVTNPADVTPGTIVAAHDGIVWRLALSPDGSRFASASEDGTIQEWDLASGQPIGEPLAVMTRDFLSVAYSPDGNTLLAGNGRGEIHGWNLTTREPAFPAFNAHNSDVWFVAYDAAGRTFASSSSDGTVRLWGGSATMIAEVYAGPSDGNEPGLVFSPDGTLLVGTADGRIGAWDADESRLVVTQAGHSSRVTDAVVSGSGDVVVSLATDQTIRIWTPATESLSARLEGSVGGALGVALAPDGTVAAGDGAGTIRMYLPGSSDPHVVSDVVHTGAVNSLDFSADGTSLVSGGADGRWWLIDATSGRARAGPIVVGQGHPIAAVAIVDGVVITGGDDGIARTWELNGSLRRELSEQHSGGVTAIARSAGRFATADRSGMIRLFDASSGDLLGAFRGDDNTIWAVAFSPDGSLLAAASADEIVTMWDSTTFEAMGVLTPHGESATSVAFVDDSTIVSLALDGTVRIWDVGLARQLGSTLSGHTGGAWHLAASPTNGMFVTSSLDGVVHVWSVLDTSAACAKMEGAFDREQQRRFLDSETAALGCSAGGVR